MVLNYRCRYGNISPEQYVAGSTIKAMDVVAVAADGYIDTAAAGASALLGVALNGGDVTERISVLPFLPGLQILITLASQTAVAPATVTLRGKRRAIAGTTGVQTVDLNAAASGDAFRVDDVVEHRDLYAALNAAGTLAADGKAYAAWVSVPQAISQYEIETP